MKNFIFDLDGTLVDPKEGITNSIRYALKKLGKPVPPADSLTWCIGPPLYDSFKIITGNSDDEYAKCAVAFYREFYLKTGIFQFKSYPNVKDTLIKLHSLDKKIFLATSKPWMMAERIIKRLGYEKIFTGVFGCEMDGTRVEKNDLLKHVIQSENLLPADSIMAGDRKYDIEGAKANHIKSCGVAYGYAVDNELEEAGADFLISEFSEILEFV